MDLQLISFSLNASLLAPSFDGVFANGDFSRSDRTTTAAVHNLVWEMRELA